MADTVPGQGLATWAQSLYLANLLVAPGVAFLALAWLWWKHRHTAPPLARLHLAQAMAGSLWAGALLLGLSATLLGLGGLDSMWAWTALIVYFTAFHSSLVLLGMVGLARAMAGREFVFPLIGPRR